MRSKTCVGGRRKPSGSATPSATTMALPSLNQDEDYVQGIVPETSIEGMEGVFADDCVSTDRGKEGICIRCNRGGDVLVCSERGCPIAFHRRCMCCKPRIDDSGSFFCPYCSYKRWIAETRRLRKKAMLARRHWGFSLTETEPPVMKRGRRMGRFRAESLIYHNVVEIDATLIVRLGWLRVESRRNLCRRKGIKKMKGAMQGYPEMISKT